VSSICAFALRSVHFASTTAERQPGVPSLVHMARKIASSASQGSISGCSVPCPEKSSAKLMALALRRLERTQSLHPASGSENVCCPTGGQAPAHEVVADRSGSRHAGRSRRSAGAEERARCALRVAQPLHAAAVSEVAVVQHRHDAKKRV